MRRGQPVEPSTATSAAGSSDGAFGEPSPNSRASKKVVKPLTKKKLEKHLAAAENRGVLYFSRLPPFLKPNKLRNLLEGYGTEVLRIYLAPEDAKSRAGRLRAGGNKKKSYSEGWVEFDNKRRAKRIASTLNNTAIGGGNRGFYAHDLWNVKYLHKFKWNHLTEKIAYEARVKQDKMRAELNQAKKETSFYLQKVEQAKAIDAMEERKRKRAEAHNDDSVDAKRSRPQAASAAPPTADSDDGLQQVRRRFKQRKAIGSAKAARASAVDERLLGSLLPQRATS